MRLDLSLLGLAVLLTMSATNSEAQTTPRVARATPAVARKLFDIERQLRAAGANPYLIVFGTNTVGKPDELDHRLDSWPVPSIVSLADNWVGELHAI